MILSRLVYVTVSRDGERSPCPSWQFGRLKKPSDEGGFVERHGLVLDALDAVMAFSEYDTTVVVVHSFAEEPDGCFAFSETCELDRLFGRQIVKDLLRIFVPWVMDRQNDIRS